MQRLRRIPGLLQCLVLAEIATGVTLGLRSTSAPQAYDANDYGSQALQFASGDVSWLAGVHNYLYPAFLAAIHGLGWWSRLGVGVVQIALLYASSFVLTLVLSRCLGLRLASVGTVVFGIAILPASAWSGYWLSEGLAAPLLLMLIALWVLACHRLLLVPSSTRTAAVVFALGLTSGLAWMTRPAFIWMPAVVGLLVGLTILAPRLLPGTRPAGSHVPAPSLLRAASLVVAFLIGALLSFMPQLLLDNNIGHLLKLNLAGDQAQLSAIVWRYATNLTTCGEPGVMFSPLSSDNSLLRSGQLVPPGSPLWAVTAAAAHLVSGWDPLPSPTYMDSWSVSPWIFVTMISGLVLAAPLLAFSLVLAKTRQLWAGRSTSEASAFEARRLAFVASLGGLLVLFAVTQLTMLNTAAEFRYNMLGWLCASTCMVFLFASGWASRQRLAIYAGVGLTISAFVLIIGQMTLNYSAYWLQCR